MDNIADPTADPQQLKIKEKKDQASTNIAIRLRDMAERFPHQRAVVYPAGWDHYGRVAYTHLTFMQLDRESDCLAYGLDQYGIRRGIRVVIMVPPGLEFFVLVFALFKVGAVPIIVDPGMGRHRMVQCMKETFPEVFIGVPKAHLLRLLHNKFFRSVKRWITVGRRWFWMGPNLEQLHITPWKPYPLTQSDADDMAAILFTTGSTGPAKGVIYTHAMFDAQVRRIQSFFDIKPGEIDLPTFPLFSLFDPALGMTAIIPDMDPTRPAHADPEKLLDTITDQGVTSMFASPALLQRLGEYASEEGVKLLTIKRVVSAGAPVSPANIEQFSDLLSEDSEIFTPYGATEAMPVLCIGSKEILSETRKFSEQGYGMCVGRPLEGIDVRIIRITDDPIEQWSDELMVGKGEIGEITIRGDVVATRYFERQDEDIKAMITDGSTKWRRMGDLGWQDNKGRVWFCGRKSHRVITESGVLFTIPCEAIFNRHQAVFRSALVGMGSPPRQKPAICIELRNRGKGIDKDIVKKELLNLAAKHPMTEDIKTVLFHDQFPVDVRHNAKIFREKLAEWAK